MWDIINPRNNYAGCRKYMTENSPVIPIFFPYTKALRRSKNASNKIMELFQFVGYFGRRGQEDVEKEVVREGESESWHGIWKGFLDNFCISCQ